jgi:hypothetical protein
MNVTENNIIVQGEIMDVQNKIDNSEYSLFCRDLQNPLSDKDRKNPLSDIIDDVTFDKLNKMNLFNEIKVRNHVIRKIFRQQRESGMNVEESILSIRIPFPYLEFDTIRKIAYGIN